jgi:hypothetical protein
LDNPFFSRARPNNSEQLRIEVQLIMFGSHKVKLEGELLDRVKKCTDACGYSSVDEFVLHALEKEVNKVLPPGEGGNTSKEIIKKRLQGLGYIE